MCLQLWINCIPTQDIEEEQHKQPRPFKHKYIIWTWTSSYYIKRRRQREKDRKREAECAVETGRWREQKKEFKMAKDAKSWDMVRSKHSATQPTLSSPCQMALKQIPMWCSQTEKTTTVYPIYIRSFIAMTQKGGNLIHPDIKQQWMLHSRKMTTITTAASFLHHYIENHVCAFLRVCT